MTDIDIDDASDPREFVAYPAGSEPQAMELNDTDISYREDLKCEIFQVFNAPFELPHDLKTGAPVHLFGLWLTQRDNILYALYECYVCGQTHGYELRDMGAVNYFEDNLEMVKMRCN